MQAQEKTWSSADHSKSLSSLQTPPLNQELPPMQPSRTCATTVPSSLPEVAQNSSVDESSTSIPMSQPTTPRPSESSPEPRNQTHSFRIDTPIRRRYRDGFYSNAEETPPFGPTSYRQNIYALDRSTILDIRLYARIERGFFLADNEWTCYRRNYFQLSGAFTLQGIGVIYEGQELPCLVQHGEGGGLHPIRSFRLGVTARIANSEKDVPLIQHTPKRDKGPQTTPQPKPIRPGGNLTMASVGGASSQLTVTFERLQFKSATANNGKRRAAQQYYVLVMELFAELEGSGELITVATTESANLVVRGRSPGHYAEADAAGQQQQQAGAGGVVIVQEGARYMSSNGTLPRPPSHHYHPDRPPIFYGPEYSSYEYPSLGYPPASAFVHGQPFPFPQHHERSNSMSSPLSSCTDAYNNGGPQRYPVQDQWNRMRMPSSASTNSTDSASYPYTVRSPTTYYDGRTALPMQPSLPPPPPSEMCQYPDMSWRPVENMSRKRPSPPPPSSTPPASPPEAKKLCNRPDDACVKQE